MTEHPNEQDYANKAEREAAYAAEMLHDAACEGGMTRDAELKQEIEALLWGWNLSDPNATIMAGKIMDVVSPYLAEDIQLPPGARVITSEDMARMAASRNQELCAMGLDVVLLSDVIWTDQPQGEAA